MMKETIKKYVELKLETDQVWLERAIVAIFERQTVHEQNIEHTIELNHRGYNHADSKRMSYYSKWIKSGKHLTGFHINIAQKRIKKYVNQLILIAQQNNKIKDK